MTSTARVPRATNRQQKVILVNEVHKRSMRVKRLDNLRFSVPLLEPTYMRIGGLPLSQYEPLMTFLSGIRGRIDTRGFKRPVPLGLPSVDELSAIDFRRINAAVPEVLERLQKVCISRSGRVEVKLHPLRLNYDTAVDRGELPEIEDAPGAD